MNPLHLLTVSECTQIATVLRRRANEIAMYEGNNRGIAPASVEMALERELKRLRRLADLIDPPREEEPEE